VLLGGAACTLPVLLLLLAAERIGVLLHIIVAALLLKSTIAINGLFQAAGDIGRALQEKDLPRARRLASWHLVSRDTSTLNEELVVAAAVESVAENSTDSVVAPLVFFLLGGVPGAWAYRFFNTCDSVLGYRDPEHEYLGKFAACWDDLLNWLPARLTALLMVPAACLAGENAIAAWRTMWAQHGRTASPNAGWTMSAMAGALGVTLEKTGFYRLGGGATPLSAGVIRRATRLAGLTMALFALLLVLVLLLVGLWPLV
jgi:adenosylcobinamide-phosphate synthase